MNENRIRASEEKEIDLIDLMIEILLHWRGLIIAFLIGGILLGGSGYYKSYKARQSAITAKEAEADKAAEAEASLLSDEEKLAGLNDQAASLKEGLSEKSLASVEAALSYYIQANNIRNYLDSSVLMQTDPFNIPSGDIIFAVVGNEENNGIILSAYEGIFESADLFNHVKDKCGFGSEVYELITVNDRDNSSFLKGTQSYDKVQVQNNIQLQSGDSRILHIHCYAGSEEDCRKMTDAVIEYAKTVTPSLQDKLGRHELAMISSSVSVGYDPSIAQLKGDKERQLHANESEIAKVMDTLGNDEKQYYSLQKNIEALNGRIKEQIEEKKANEIVIPTAAVSKKRVLIGLILGAFVYAGIICIAYIFSQKIKDSDDFTVTFRTAQLGKLYGQRKFKGLGKAIDKWLYSFKNRGRKIADADEAAGIIAANAALSAVKADIKKLGIICADGVAEYRSGLIEKLSAAMKEENIEARVFSKLLYSRDEAYSTKDLDAVIFIAAAGKSTYTEVWDAMEVIGNQKIGILGGIMA